MTALRTDLPPSIVQRAQRVFRLARARLVQERLLALQRETAQDAAAVRRAADQLHALAGTAAAGSRATLVAQELEAAAAGLGQLAEDLHRPFLLFVVGMGKFGKSTLINALLGQRAAAMDALPKTWKIDVFTCTLPPGIAQVRTYDGRVERLPVADAAALIDEEERRREESEEKVWELFQAQARHLASVTEKELLRQELEMLHLYRSPIVEVRWPVRAAGISRHFDVVDTPGLWQERPGRTAAGSGPSAGGPSGRAPLATGPGGGALAGPPFSLVSAEDLRSYYLQADGVLWLLDATKLAAGKPHELMRDLNAALGRVGGVARNAVAVLNRIDLVRRQGGDAAVARVVAQAREMLADLFWEVIPISAREALEAQEAGDPQRLRQSGLPELLAVIDQRFRVGGAAVRWWSKSQGRRQYLLQVQAVSRRYREELSEARAELEKRAAEAQRHLDSVQRQAQRRFADAVAAHRLKVRDNIQDDRLAALLQRRGEAREQYLRDAIYEMDELQAVLANLVSRVQRQYRETAARLIPLQQFAAFRYAAPSGLAPAAPGLWPAQSPLDVDVEAGDFSGAAHVLLTGTLALVGASLLGPVGLLLGPVVSRSMFEDYITSLKLRKVRENLEEQFDMVLGKAQEQWDRTLDRLHREYAAHLATVREGSFAQVHMPPDRLPAAQDALAALEAMVHRPVSAPALRDVLLVPWVQQHQRLA